MPSQINRKYALNQLTQAGRGLRLAEIIGRVYNKDDELDADRVMGQLMHDGEVYFDAKAERYFLVKAPKSPVNASGTKTDWLLEQLRKAPEGMTANALGELAEQEGVSKIPDVASELWRLHNEGRVSRAEIPADKRGADRSRYRYSVAGPSPDRIETAEPVCLDRARVACAPGDVDGALSRLEKHLETPKPGFTVTELELKQRVLWRLGQIMEPSIAAVLQKIYDDLAALSSHEA